jgi:hypothetical protein
VIAPLRAGVPVPDAVADHTAAQLPERVREAVVEVATVGRLLTSRPHAVAPFEVRMEAGGNLHQRLAHANKVLAAHNPGLIHRWGDMPQQR